MKISEYPEKTQLEADDIFLVDGASGTRRMLASTLGLDLLDNEPMSHNRYFRGKNLGSVYTQAQKSAITAGTFDDIWVGDYWEIGGIRYRVAALNYWLGTGDNIMTRNHVVIVPDTVMYNARINPTNSILSGYANSEMFKSNLNNAATTAKAAFGSSGVISYRRLFSTVINQNAMPTSKSWYDSTVALMTERQVIGNTNWEAGFNGNRALEDTNVFQFPLFRIAPEYATKYLSDNGSYWLDSVVTGGAYAQINKRMGTSQAGVSNVSGVRPCFPIG